MDIDYSKFQIAIDWIREYPVHAKKYYWNVVFCGDFVISGESPYTTKRAAIRGAKRAIKRIVETAVGDK